MSVGLEQIPAANPNETDSAPSSADFYNSHLLSGAEIDGGTIDRINFNRSNGVILLGIDNKDLEIKLINPPALRELKNSGFKPKDEMHITVLNYDNGKRVLDAVNKMPMTDRESWLDLVGTTTESLDWQWNSTGKIVQFKGKNKDLKIITLVDCPMVADFYDWVENLFSIKLIRHPMHITLMKRWGNSIEKPNALNSEINLSHPISHLGQLALGY